MCDLYNVDVRISNLVSKDLENYYANHNEASLFGRKKVLSPAVYSQLEACIYKDFIDSFEMFSELKINIIRCV